MRHTLTLVVCALALSSCKAVAGRGDIEYKVSGTATRASITYQSSSGSSSQTNNSVLPWGYTFEAKKGDFLYVSAQNETPNAIATSCVRVEIFKNGDLIESGFSCGPFVIASASATN